MRLLLIAWTCFIVCPIIGCQKEISIESTQQTTATATPFHVLEKNIYITSGNDTLYYLWLDKPTQYTLVSLDRHHWDKWDTDSLFTFK